MLFLDNKNKGKMSNINHETHKWVLDPACYTANYHFTTLNMKPKKKIGKQNIVSKIVIVFHFK